MQKFAVRTQYYYIYWKISQWKTKTKTKIIPIMSLFENERRSEWFRIMLIAFSVQNKKSARHSATLLLTIYLWLSSDILYSAIEMTAPKINIAEFFYNGIKSRNNFEDLSFLLRFGLTFRYDRTLENYSKMEKLVPEPMTRKMLRCVICLFFFKEKR